MTEKRDTDLTRKPGAPDHSVRGVAHDYWIEKRKIRLEKQAASGKRQAASNKGLDKPIDLRDKVI